jgi:hypothetical protein
MLARARRRYKVQVQEARRGGVYAGLPSGMVFPGGARTAPWITAAAGGMWLVACLTPARAVAGRTVARG